MTCGEIIIFCHLLASFEGYVSRFLISTEDVIAGCSGQEEWLKLEQRTRFQDAGGRGSRNRVDCQDCPPLCLLLDGEFLNIYRFDYINTQ